MKFLKAILLSILFAGLFIACSNKKSETPATNQPAVNAEPEKKVREQIEPLYVSAEKCGFKMGAAFSADDLNKQKRLDLLSSDFNSVTPTNELKLYSLLSQSRKSNDDGMPYLNFVNADKMLAWAQENNIKVRGHVLVWDAYMTDWFFYEDYKNKVLADSETIKSRMKYCINEVITHCEEKFPGVIYCWDVVNEAVADGLNETKSDDSCRIRTTRGGASNLYYDTIGRDYVKYAFKYARECVNKNGYDIKLFYNDYNTFSPIKRKAIISLVQEINAKDAINPTGEKLVDGIGMQGYVGGYGTQSGCMNAADITAIKESIETYASLGFEVQITEMAIRNYEKIELQKHAEFYGKMAAMLHDINKTADGKFTCWAIWGLVDNPGLDKNNYSYKMNGTLGGLYGWQLDKKDAFYNASDELAK